MESNDPVAKAWRQLPLNHCDLSSHEAEFFPLFAELCKGAERILEIGAGRGRMVELLRKAGVTAEFYCLDINDYVQEAPGIPLIGDARALPFRDQSFDVVYSLGVVEHFPQTRTAILEHARVTKIGGTVLITTPRLSPFTVLRFAAWLFRYHNLGTFEQVLGRNLTLCQMKRYFQSADLEIIYAKAAGLRLPGLAQFEHIVSKFISQRLFGAYLCCVGRRQRSMNSMRCQ